jgi:hypothetical protein
MSIIQISLAINILVLVPVSLGLLFDFKKMEPVFGARTTAREILCSIYLTILLASFALLFAGSISRDYARNLLVAQVIYKSLSVLLIRNKRTPVLWFNLAVALFHAFTLSVGF